MVIMDKQQYTDKATTLLQDTNTYRTIPKDPTNKLKNKVTGILRDMKQTGRLKDTSYCKIYPTSAVPSKFYGLPKIHKVGTPIRLIVSSRGSITYGVAKELAGIIFPLVGQSQHHHRNIQHFIEKIQQVKLQPGKVISSYDVKALFTLVPVDPAITIVQERLTQDPTLSQRTQMSIPQIVTLLELCLKNTYFLFQGKYYEQVHSAAMGSPISPLIANMFMEEFEAKALQSAPDSPSLWVRFVDDTLVIQEAEHSQQFLQHINSQDPNIQFTVEEPGTDGSIPFLDTKVKPGPNNTIHTTVYRKPTHRDQYLHWDSNHFITAKNSVYNTLAHRAKVVSSTTEDLNKEMEHLNKALKECHFPNWALIDHNFSFNKNTTSTTSKHKGGTNHQQQPGQKQ